jgi:tRNA(fMet)-specific endonuclease VapC
MTIADTDVLIDYLSGAEPGARRVSEAIESGALLTTAITRFELLSGARTARAEAGIRKLLDVISTLPVDEPCADRAALVRRSLEKSGASIGMADSLIAGIALVNNATLLTRNRKHFERVAGLRLAVP